MDVEDNALVSGKSRIAVLAAIARGSAVLEKSLCLAPASDPYVQLTRSLIVSAVALTGDAIVLLVAKEILGVHYLQAAAAGFVAGVAINYMLSANWTFATSKLASRNTEIVVFFAICLAGLALNLIVISFLVEHLNFDYRIAKFASAAAVFFWNFFMRKKLLY